PRTTWAPVCGVQYSAPCWKDCTRPRPSPRSRSPPVGSPSTPSGPPAAWYPPPIMPPTGWVPLSGEENTRPPRKSWATPPFTRYSPVRSEEHTSELQSRENLVCRLLLEKKKEKNTKNKQAA